MKTHETVGEHPVSRALLFADATVTPDRGDVIVTMTTLAPLDAFVAESTAGLSGWTFRWSVGFRKIRIPRSRSAGYNVTAQLRDGTWESTFRQINFGDAPRVFLARALPPPSVTGSTMELRFPRSLLEGMDDGATWSASSEAAGRGAPDAVAPQDRTQNRTLGF